MNFWEVEWVYPNTSMSSTWQSQPRIDHIILQGLKSYNIKATRTFVIYTLDSHLHQFCKSLFFNIQIISMPVTTLIPPLSMRTEISPIQHSCEIAKTFTIHAVRQDFSHDWTGTKPHAVCQSCTMSSNKHVRWSNGLDFFTKGDRCEIDQLDFGALVLYSCCFNEAFLIVEAATWFLSVDDCDNSFFLRLWCGFDVEDVQHAPDECL